MTSLEIVFSTGKSLFMRMMQPTITAAMLTSTITFIKMTKVPVVFLLITVEIDQEQHLRA